MGTRKRRRLRGNAQTTRRNPDKVKKTLVSREALEAGKLAAKAYSILIWQLWEGLESLDCRPVFKTERSGVARCPGHDDSKPSLYFWEGDDGYCRVKCHAGCDPLELLQMILEASGEEEPTGLFESATDRPGRGSVTRQEFDPDEMEELMSGMIENAHGSLDSIGEALGATGPVLTRLGVARIPRSNLTAWPMLGPGRRLSGIQLRSSSGRKWCFTGSRLGHFWPTDMVEGGPLFVAEGASDTANLLRLRFDAIGRPSCNAKLHETVRIVAEHFSGRPIVVCADRDQGGRRGARKLTAALETKGVDVALLTPPRPFGDVREWAAGSKRPRIDICARAKKPRWFRSWSQWHRVGRHV